MTHSTARAITKPATVTHQDATAGKKAHPAPQVAPSISSSVGILYNGSPAVSLGGLVQRKVVIGAPNDQFEQEADRVAERVTAGQFAPSVTRIPSAGLAAVTQRQPESGQEEEEPAQTLAIQRQPDDEEAEEEPAQTTAVQRQRMSERDVSIQRQPQAVQRQGLKHGNYPPFRGEHPEIASWPIKLRNLARDIHHHPARYEHYLLEALMDMRLHQDAPGPDQPGAGSTGQPAIRMDVEGAPTPQIPQIIVMRSLPSEVAFALIGADPQLVEAISQLPEADQNRIVDVLASILVSEGIDYARRNPDFARSAAAEQERRRQQREERRRRPVPTPAPGAPTGSVQGKFIQRQDVGVDEEEHPVQTLEIQRQPADEEEEPAQTLAVQRQPADEEEEHAQAFPIQRQADAEDDEQPVQAQANGFGGPLMRSAAASAIRGKGVGEPLRPAVRSTLERGMGVDLGDVRVHASAGAQRSARLLRARAFTHRNHIWLGSGESQADLRLMAHETTHVLQQDGVVRRLPRQESDQPASEHDPRYGDEPTVTGDEQAVSFVEPALREPDSDPDPTAPSTSAEEVPETESQAGDNAAEPEPAIQEPNGQGNAGTAPPVPASGVASGEGDATAPSPPENSDAQGKERLHAVMGNLGKLKKQQQGVASSPKKARAAAIATADQASKAAPSPENEAEAHGKGAQVGVMAAQNKGEVDKKSFLDLVKEKLRQMDMPSTPQEMDKFKQSGGASGLTADVKQGAKTQQTAVQGAIATATAAEPQPAAQRVPGSQPVQDRAPVPRKIGAQEVLPPAKSESEVSLQAGKDEVEAELGKEKLTAERLQKANDPRFSGAQEARSEVDAHVEQGPKDYRASEAQILRAEKSAVKSDERSGAEKMQSGRQQSGAVILARQKGQMSKEESDRRRISSDLDNIYKTSKKKVDDKLAWLDIEVDKEFTKHETSARQKFEDFVKYEFDQWKDRRYSGLSGKWTWVKDRFKDINELPAVKQIYVDGQQLYFDELDDGIDEIGTLIDTTLEWCQEEIRKGHEEVKTYLSNLDSSLKKIGADAAEDVLGRFSDLKGQVEEHRDALADKLVQRYQQSREKLNTRIEEIKDANRSLVIKAKRKIEAVIDAIRKFRDRLLSLLARVRSVVELILDDPIGFLKNLLRAVKQGFALFKQNIWKHLQAGIFGWLFGALSGIGIELPKDFGFKSVIGFILSVVGVTWDRLRKKAVRLVGERNVAVLEKVVGYLTTLFSSGPAGLWKEIQQDVGNLYDMVIEGVKQWVVTKIVTAAITKLVSMFNPVGAIVQAVLTIYNVVMFFVERIQQIMQLVETVINSLADIVAGRIDTAAGYVEKALGQMIPLIIAFLARLLGLGGIAQRVKKIIDQVRGKVDRAIDKALKRILMRFSKTAKSATGKGARKLPTKDPAVREKRKQQAVRQVQKAMERGITRPDLIALLKGLKRDLNLKSARLDQDDDVTIENSSPVKLLGVAYDLRVTKGRTPAGKRTKSGRGAVKLGQFSATGKRLPTARGVLEKSLISWPYPEMPTDAIRPQSATGSFTGKVDAIDRVADEPSMLYTAEYGNVESRLRDRYFTFDSGHLIANEFGGRESDENIVPMKPKFNQGTGAFRKLENWVRSLLPDVTPATQDVVVTMTVSSSYPGPVRGSLSLMAKRINSRLKAIGFQKEATEAKGGTFSNRRKVELDSFVRSRPGYAETSVSVPARIPSSFRATVEFTALVDAKNQLDPVEQARLDQIAAGTGLAQSASAKSHRIIVMEKAGRKKKPSSKSGGQLRKVTAKKTFVFPHYNP